MLKKQILSDFVFHFAGAHTIRAANKFRSSFIWGYFATSVALYNAQFFIAIFFNCPILTSLRIQEIS